MTPWSIVVLCSSVTLTFAQSNGMDMSMDGAMSLAAGNMLPYLHFTPGDTVWFNGWVPSSAGAMVGTCIGVFLLSIMERWLAACLGLAERHWSERAHMLITESDVTSVSPKYGSAASTPSPIFKKSGRRIPSFVPEFDITRGVLFAAQKALQILFMLIVMTFQLAFILSIIVGSGVGETLFGRFSSPNEH